MVLQQNSKDFFLLFYLLSSVTDRYVRNKHIDLLLKNSISYLKMNFKWKRARALTFYFIFHMCLNFCHVNMWHSPMKIYCAFLEKAKEEALPFRTSPWLSPVLEVPGGGVPPWVLVQHLLSNGRLEKLDSLLRWTKLCQDCSVSVPDFSLLSKAQVFFLT